MHPSTPPPRFILGAALLFWGMMTGRWVTGAVLAIIVESAHWVKLRWEFDEKATDRAWKLTVVLLAISSVLILLEGSPYFALRALLTWLPPLLLPMQFVQSFGLAPSMPLNTFSLVANHRRKRNLRLGLTESIVRFNFGNFYFVATLIGATLGSDASGQFRMVFLPGLIVLTGWLLLSAGKTKPLPLIVCLTLAGAISLAGQQGLDRLQELLGNRAAGRSSGFDPNTKDTLIGLKGEVTQSPDIVWRAKIPEKARTPRLLRTATYNSYNKGRWTVQPRLPEKDQFKTLDAIEPRPAEIFHIAAPQLTFAEQTEAIRPDLPHFDLRGAAANETPMLLPGDVASLHAFELDSIDRNPLGTIRIFPKHSVVEGTVSWAAARTPETPPDEDFDTQKSALRQERQALRGILDDLDLDSMPTVQQKLAALQGWFSRDFEYTRKLTIRGENSALIDFLTETRAGHCEYFATAAVVLLRQAGIPARYATGYAMVERDPARNEFVMRGTHGHAWCRVWDAAAGQWLDFDPTPAAWPLTVLPQVTRMQRLHDVFTRLRQDFFLWRNRPANRLAVTLVMAAIALAVVGFIGIRLWRSRRRLAEEQRNQGYGGPVALTPLNALEIQAEKRLGVRPPGQPLGEWLMKLRPALADDRARLQELASILTKYLGRSWRA